MYDPISGNDDDQYIELYNQGTNTVSLANWQFTAGVTFTFPPTPASAPTATSWSARTRPNCSPIIQPQRGQHLRKLFRQIVA
jgi:hypothetical protein